MDTVTPHVSFWAFEASNIILTVAILFFRAIVTIFGWEDEVQTYKLTQAIS